MHESKYGVIKTTVSNVNLYNNVLYPSPERLPVDNSSLIYTVKQV